MNWRSIGNVTPELFHDVLKAAGSPLAKIAGDCYDAAKPHSALCLAMLHRESSYATAFNRNKPENRNALNLRPPDGIGYMSYPSWSAGLQAWRERITSPTYKHGIYHNTTTIAELIAVYAPAFDSNDEGGYVKSIETDLARWGVTPKETPMAPVIYTLWQDYARFGLTKTQADQIIAKRFENRRDGSIQGRPTHIMFHIQAGYTPGSLKHWLTVSASSTVMIQRDGSILQVIPEQHGPWTNGDDYAPKPTGQALVDQPGNSNIWTLSIEAEGVTGAEPLQYPEQMDAIEWQARDWMRRYPETAKPDHQLEHADVQRIQKPNCAGAYYPVIMKRLTSVSPPIEPHYAEPAPISWKQGDTGVKDLNGVDALAFVMELKVVAGNGVVPVAHSGKGAGATGPKLEKDTKVTGIGSYRGGPHRNAYVVLSDNSRAIRSKFRPLVPLP